MPLNTCEFNLTKYREVLCSFISTGRTFREFSNDSDHGLILRLDVDYDLAWAAELAAINKELGVMATFFIQVSSALYNALAPDSAYAIRAISGARQRIGLHYSPSAGPWDRKRLDLEYGILKSIAPEALRLVAWHNPEGDMVHLNSEAEHAGFLTTYMSRWFGETRYVSDSNGRNYPNEIIRFVAASREPLLQVLLHPFNWYHGGDNMAQILARAFHAKVGTLAAAFDQNKVWKQGIGETAVRRLGSSDLYGASLLAEEEGV